MKPSGKVLLIVGLAVGYVLGARAGRERYDQIAGAVSKFWRSPRVQKQVDRSVDFVGDKLDQVVDIAATGARNVVQRVTAGSSAKKPAAAAAKKPAAVAKTAAKRPAAAKPAAASAKSAPKDA